MDDASESRFRHILRKFFTGKNDASIEQIIREAEKDGELKKDEMAMLLNILRLGRKQVVEIMIPRPDIVCAEINDNLQTIAELFISTGHSRIPIFQENRDNIIGILHAKDLIKPLLVSALETFDVRQLMRRPFFIPETKNVKDLLTEFKSRKNHMAVALDEYGGTSGLVTLEDVLEEIVGEIEDEYDLPRPEDIQRQEDRTILVSGRASLEDLKEEIGLDLDSEQVETIGGYLSELAGRVPDQGEYFSIAGYRFRVKEADPKQVRWLVVEPPKDMPPEECNEPSPDTV